MIQYIFLVPIPKAGVETIHYIEVCDKVSVADIDQPLVATICDSVDSLSTLTVVGMLKFH